MAPRKQAVTLNGTTSKGKAIDIIGRTVPLPAIDQPHTIAYTGSSSSSGAVANVQVPRPQYEDQLFQMLADMKEQMKEQ